MDREPGTLARLKANQITELSFHNEETNPTKSENLVIYTFQLFLYVSLQQMRVRGPACYDSQLKKERSYAFELSTAHK